MVKEKMEAKIAAAEKEVVELKALAAEIESEKQAAYDAGFTDGAASVGSDVVYTEEELQQKIAEAVAPLNTKVEKLSAEVQKFPAMLDEAVAKKQLEVDKLKAAIQVEIADAKVDSSRLEAALA